MAEQISVIIHITSQGMHTPVRVFLERSYLKMTSSTIRFKVLYQSASALAISQTDLELYSFVTARSVYISKLIVEEIMLTKSALGL